MKNILSGIFGICGIVVVVIVIGFVLKFAVIAGAGIFTFAVAAMPFVLGIGALWVIGWVVTSLFKS
jgi:hypothetical protein